MDLKYIDPQTRVLNYCWQSSSSSRGVEGYWSLQTWIQWSTSVGGAECGGFCRTVETCSPCIGMSPSCSRCGAVISGVLACVHMYMLWGGKKLHQKVFCTPVQTRIYTGTSVVDTAVNTFAHTRHRVYICTRVRAICLFVLSNLSTTCVCITGAFQHPHAWVRGGWNGVFFSLSMVCACCWRGRLCFGRDRDWSFLVYFSIFAGVMVVGVCL